MFHVPNQFRNHLDPKLGSDDSDGNNGLFQFAIQGYIFNCIASDGLDWEHVSITIDRNRTPNWEQMCFIKDVFWDEEDIVVQYHPSKSQYVNMHPYCLHLWRNTKYDIISPPPELIGVITKTQLIEVPKPEIKIVQPGEMP